MRYPARKARKELPANGGEHPTLPRKRRGKREEAPHAITTSWKTRRGNASGFTVKASTAAKQPTHAGSSTACSREQHHDPLRRTCRDHQFLLPARRLAPGGD